MNRFFLQLARFAVWLNDERIALWAMACYGAHIWILRSFHVNNAFSAWGVPEPVFAVPLLAGAACKFYGLRRQSAGWLLTGALLGFCVFLSATISCALVSFTSTGFPIYGPFATVFFFAQALRRATGREYSFRND